MGYHVTILRTSGAQQIPIKDDEIKGIPKAFPEWQYDPEQGALFGPAEEEGAPALWFSDGGIWTSNPSSGTLAAMISIAGHLEARVRGDEMETYRSAEDTYLHPDDAAESVRIGVERRQSARVWTWKQRGFNAAIFGGFVSAIVCLKWFGVLE